MEDSNVTFSRASQRSHQERSTEDKRSILSLNKQSHKLILRHLPFWDLAMKYAVKRPNFSVCVLYNLTLPDELLEEKAIISWLKRRSNVNRFTR